MIECKYNIICPECLGIVTFNEEHIYKIDYYGDTVFAIDCELCGRDVIFKKDISLVVRVDK